MMQPLVFLAETSDLFLKPGEGIFPPPRQLAREPLLASEECPTSAPMARIITFLTLMMTVAVLLACSAPQNLQFSSQLDDLFVRLRTTASAAEAHDIELAILHVWAQSGQPEVDALMYHGVEMARTGELDGAMKIFDRVVDIDPDFAEAYNQRALVHAMRDEYSEAIEDIRRVLALEPRHFGALAGLGRILLLYDCDEAALVAFEAALAVNPYLDQVREQAGRLRNKLAGIPI